MAQKVLLVFLTIFLSQHITAQHHEDDLRMIYVSAKAGLTSVNMAGQYNYGASNLKASSKLTPHIYLGYGLDYSTRNRFHIAIGYASSGQEQSDIIGGILRSRDYSLHYLSAPLSYKRVFGGKRGYAWKTPNLYALASFQFDYLIASNSSWSLNTSNQSLVEFLNGTNASDFVEDIEATHGVAESYDDLYKNYDQRASLGGGVQYFILPDYLLYLEVSYQYGFLDINNNSWRYGNDTRPYKSVKNTGLLFSIGVNKYLKAF